MPGSRCRIPRADRPWLTRRGGRAPVRLPYVSSMAGLPPASVERTRNRFAYAVTSTVMAELVPAISHRTLPLQGTSPAMTMRLVSFRAARPEGWCERAMTDSNGNVSQPSASVASRKAWARRFRPRAALTARKRALSVPGAIFANLRSGSSTGHADSGSAGSCANRSPEV
jgi:hypothetical protein